MIFSLFCNNSQKSEVILFKKSDENPARAVIVEKMSTIKIRYYCIQLSILLLDNKERCFNLKHYIYDIIKITSDFN